MLRKTIWLPKCLVTSSTCEDLILFHLYLILNTEYFPMLNDINVKSSWHSLRRKYQLKQITRARKKKCCNHWKLYSEKNEVNISASKSDWIRSWLYVAGCPGQKAVCLVRQSWKMINLICKNISDRMELSQPAFTTYKQLSKCASTLS